MAKEVTILEALKTLEEKGYGMAHAIKYYEEANGRSVAEWLEDQELSEEEYRALMKKPEFKDIGHTGVIDLGIDEE